jgi:hypothetical protein
MAFKFANLYEIERFLENSVYLRENLSTILNFIDSQDRTGRYEIYFAFLKRYRSVPFLVELSHGNFDFYKDAVEYFENEIEIKSGNSRNILTVAVLSENTNPELESFNSLLIQEVFNVKSCLTSSDYVSLLQDKKTVIEIGLGYLGSDSANPIKLIHVIGDYRKHFKLIGKYSNVVIVEVKDKNLNAIKQTSGTFNLFSNLFYCNFSSKHQAPEFLNVNRKDRIYFEGTVSSIKSDLTARISELKCSSSIRHLKLSEMKASDEKINIKSPKTHGSLYYPSNFKESEFINPYSNLSLVDHKMFTSDCNNNFRPIFGKQNFENPKTSYLF